MIEYILCYLSIGTCTFIIGFAAGHAKGQSSREMSEEVRARIDAFNRKLDELG